MSTTKTLLEVLQRHYIKPGPYPGGIFLPECGVNGGQQTRADALYIGFTSSSGRLLVGHELKVSRADWRKELDTVGKADFWADNCHQWIIVAPGPEVVPAEEIPHGWGLMYPNPRTKTRMKIVVKPQTHADRTPAWTAVRSIMARLDTLQHQRDFEVKQTALTDARAQAEKELEARSAQRLTPLQQRRLRVLDDIEELLGAPIDTWAHDKAIGPGQAAAALRLVRSVDAIAPHASSYIDDELRRTATAMLSCLDEFMAARAALLALSGGRA